MASKLTTGQQVTNRYTETTGVITATWQHDGHDYAEVQYDGRTERNTGLASAFVPLHEDTETLGLAASALDQIDSIMTRLADLRAVGAIDSYTFRSIRDSLHYCVERIHDNATDVDGIASRTRDDS